MSDSKNAGRRIIQIKLVTLRADDDPRIIKAIEQAVQVAPRPSASGHEILPDGFGKIAPDAVRDEILEGEVISTVEQRLDVERAVLAELQTESSHADLVAIKAHAERIVRSRSAWKSFCDDLRSTDAEADDQTPWWRFAVKVVIKVLERVTAGRE